MHILYVYAYVYAYVYVYVYAYAYVMYSAGGTDAFGDGGKGGKRPRKGGNNAVLASIQSEKK